ncbi:Abi family protein [Pseudomonas salomonii]|uniref:Abi family protein n=1 Tax=Pseudomonas salomonii TaxID=191391 RepID=A0A7Y8GGW5_9PSED|nr:Abi family protein [Pseudomonas salomonii]
MRPLEVKSTLAMLSAPRLSNYATYFNTSDEHDLYACYQWNNEVSRSFLPIIHLIEVSLRNAYHRELSLYFSKLQTGRATSTFDWYIHAKLDIKSREAVDKILVKTTRPDDVISRLTFGFWHNITETKDIPWAQLLPKVFPDINRSWSTRPKRDWLYVRVKMVNDFRNRVSHWEPIWKLGDLFEERRHRSGDAPLTLISPSTKNPSESIVRLHTLHQRMSALLDGLCKKTGKTYRDSYSHEHLRWVCSTAGISSFRSSEEHTTIEEADTEKSILRIMNERKITTVKNGKKSVARIFPL